MINELTLGGVLLTAPHNRAGELDPIVDRLVVVSPCSVRGKAFAAPLLTGVRLLIRMFRVDVPSQLFFGCKLLPALAKERPVPSMNYCDVPLK